MLTTAENNYLSNSRRQGAPNQAILPEEYIIYNSPDAVAALVAEYGEYPRSIDELFDSVYFLNAEIGVDFTEKFLSLHPDSEYFLADDIEPDNDAERIWMIMANHFNNTPLWLRYALAGLAIYGILNLFFSKNK